MNNNDYIVTGMLFGDEGKGTIVDHLAFLKRPVSVVRTGGPQAAHNVINAEGTHHTFAQFGSASLQQVPTTLSQFMLVNPFNLVTEGDLLYSKTGWNPFTDLLISETSLMITPIHMWLNRKREEARGAAAHGSCAEGIGETRLFHIRHSEAAPVIADLLEPNLVRLKTKLNTLLRYAEEEAGMAWDENTVDELMDQYIQLSSDGFLNIVSDEQISDRINSGFIIFEGSQGVLLDETYGFHPHTTWGSSTSEKARQLLLDAGKEPGTVVGVTRTYATRHGFGPFPSELPNTEEVIQKFPELHNTFGRYQGAWRRGHLDLPLLEYAGRANRGVDEVAITHCDLFNPADNTAVTGYRGWKDIPTDFFFRDRDKQEEITNHLMGLTLADAETTTHNSFEELETAVSGTLNAPVMFRSYGPSSADKQYRS
jgi:adenylosuccinate synthase